MDRDFTPCRRKQIFNPSQIQIPLFLPKWILEIPIWISFKKTSLLHVQSQALRYFKIDLKCSIVLIQVHGHQQHFLLKTEIANFSLYNTPGPFTKCDSKLLNDMKIFDCFKKDLPGTCHIKLTTQISINWTISCQWTDGRINTTHN